VIHPNILKRQAHRDRLTAAAVERDYILTHVLAAITARDTDGRIAFKGGTALRLCHFEAYRYSADLDFSLLDDMDLDTARSLIAGALDDCRERLALPALRLTDTTPPRIEYVGPLASKPRTLKLDLADDELVENTTRLPIVDRYPDQEPRECLVYALEEVAAEKLRCVIQRLQCRDLYDLHELLVVRSVDAREIWPLFERKARYRQVDPDRFPNRFREREPEWQRRWTDELSEYILGETPHFDGVLRAVRRELRFATRA
jgi:hypothetical protein